MLPTELARDFQDPIKRRRILFSSEILSRLETYTGLPPGEIAEILVELTVEKFAQAMGVLLARPLNRPGDEIEGELVELLTAGGDTEPEEAVGMIIRGSGKDPVAALQSIKVQEKLEKARLEAVEDILQNYSVEGEYEEGMDPRRIARSKILRKGIKDREEAGSYWDAPGEKEPYLTPQEFAREKDAEAAIEKRGKGAEFKNWLDQDPKIDWEELEKQAEEKEKARERELLASMAAKAQELANRKKDAKPKTAAPEGRPEPESEPEISDDGLGDLEEPDLELTDAELEKLLDKNPIWRQAVEEDPSWRDKLRKNPGLIGGELEDLEGMGEGVDPEGYLEKYPLVKKDEAERLAPVAKRIRPGGLTLPLDYYLWKLQNDRHETQAAARGQDPNVPDEVLASKYKTLDRFVSEFFEMGQSKKFELKDLWKYGQEKGLSKRRLADLVNVSSQTLTVRSKELRDRENLQDPEAVVRYLEPRRGSGRDPSKSTKAYDPSWIPDWIVDLFLPAVVKADDFVSDVSFLAEKFIEWSKDPEIQRRIDAEAEKEGITINWSPKDNLTAFASAMDVVAKKMAPKISEEIIDELDGALMDIDKHLAGGQDAEVLSPAGEGPLDWRLALRRFFDPRVTGVLAKHGITFVAPGQLLGEYKDIVRYLVLKNMRKKGSEIGEEAIGKELFTELERQTYKLLTDKQILTTFVGETGSKDKDQTRTLIDKGRHLISPSLRKKLTPEKNENSIYKEGGAFVESKGSRSEEPEEKSDKFPSRTLVVRGSEVRRFKSLLGGKLKSLENGETVGDLKDWFRGISKEGKLGKASAKDLVKFLAFLWQG